MTSDDIQAALQRASALRQAGRVPEAIAAYEALLARWPALPDSWYNLGLLQRKVGRGTEALASYAKALQHNIKGPEEVHLNRAVILADRLRRPDDAEAELKLALKANPAYLPALLNLGNLHEDRGNREAARVAYDRVLELEPGNTLALARLPDVRAIEGPDDPLVVALRDRLADPATLLPAQADLGFGLGRALDAVGAYDEAFAAYEAANGASRQVAAAQGRIYDRAAHEGFIDRLIATFPLPTALAPSASTRTPPIFICGMFRSGSSLTEQILVSHEQVTGGGELNLVPDMVRDYLQPFPQSLPRRNPEALPTLRDAYLERLTMLFPGADRITDKRPDNFLYIGLIKTLFPDAKIVHTRRNPIDNGLSVFFLHLDHTMSYALDLGDIAHWYGQYRRLMAHWQALYPGDIHDLDYDALVADPRPHIEALLRFCDLPWDDACLDFHRTASIVKTASVWQVRQPLYQRASGRWRHYERHIGALIAALPDGSSGG